MILSDAPHHIGGAEVMVKAVIRSLHFLLISALSLMESDCVPKQIFATTNNHPLGFSTKNMLF